jgi:two-component system sensor histidine kinase KdpD
MDVEAILHRHPQVCLVDSLAYDNPPGSPNPKRWQDVEQLLAAGISVITSINLQYIEEQREKVERITGEHATETVPQSFLSTADEMEVVDAPPEMALQRTADAGPDGTVENQVQQLSELREIALLLAAEVVDRQLETYLQRRGVQQLWGTQERILVWITPDTHLSAVIASGKRNADRFHGELIVAYISQPDLRPAEQEALEKHLSYARGAGAQVEALDGEDQVDAVIRFAKTRGVTQIFVRHGARENVWERIFGSAIDRLIRSADGIDVRVFPQ